MPTVTFTAVAGYVNYFLHEFTDVDGTPFPALDATNDQTRSKQKSLEVRVASIPEASTGHIPYARTVHSKYLVVDENILWLGTSNWEEDYFTASRNIETIFHDEALAAQGARVFERLWSSAYAQPLEPLRRYERRKID